MGSLEVLQPPDALPRTVLLQPAYRLREIEPGRQIDCPAGRRLQPHRWLLARISSPLGVEIGLGPTLQVWVYAIVGGVEKWEGGLVDPCDCFVE